MTTSTVLPSSITVAATLTGLAFTVLVTRRMFNSRKSHRLPPGPSRTPLVGNALQIPQENTWIAFSEWAQKYGDVMYLEVLGRSMLIISSAGVAKELLDKRSSIYSNRPFLAMANLSGYTNTFAILPYGDRWRQQRKLVAQDFSSSGARRYHTVQEIEARKLMRTVLNKPELLESEVKLRIGTVIMRATYGYHVKDEKDPFLTLPLTAMENFSQATTPGSWLVDVVPRLKNVPAWFPGSGFLKTAAQWKQIVLDATYGPYSWSKKEIQEGSAVQPSLCATVFSDAGGDLDEEREDDLVWAASSVMGGGMDTNMSTIMTFFLAMILFPDVQKKAKAEIDAVVGTGRLPSLADKPDLPYIRSLVTEVYRWNTTVPLGLPHSLTQDDYFNDYYIPKDTMILANIWHMLHDPDVYPDPATFNPDRYNNLDTEMQKVTDLTFGFGRRVCPGYNFAQGTIFAIIATALATCDILPALDAKGKAIEPEVAYTSGTIVFPKPYKYRLKARSDKAMALLEEAQHLKE